MTELDIFNLVKKGGYNPLDGPLTTNELNRFKTAGLFKQQSDLENQIQDTNNLIGSLNLQQAQNKRPPNVLQKIGSAFGQYGMDNRMPTDEFLNLPKNERRKMQIEGLQKFGEMMNLVAAQQSGSPQRIAQAQNTIAQRQAIADAEREEAEKKKQISDYFGNNQQLAQIAEIFGEETAFAVDQKQKAQQKLIQEQNAQAEIAAINERRKINAYIDAGYTEGQAFAIVVGGAKPEDVVNVGIDEEQVEQDQKIQALVDGGFDEQTARAMVVGGATLNDIQSLNKGNISKPIQDLDAEIDKDYEESEGLQSIDQAFSLKDTIDNTANKIFGPVLGTPAKETNSAINAKNLLNENLRERFVNEYSGRPSVYLNQRIDALLPMGTYISEFDAMQKYQEIKRILDRGKEELQKNINSELFSGTELLELQNEYKKTSFLIRDLETVIGNLNKQKVSLDTDGLDSDGTYNFVFDKDSGF